MGRNGSGNPPAVNSEFVPSTHLDWGGAAIRPADIDGDRAPWYYLKA
jgi:hypothetical protein